MHQFNVGDVLDQEVSHWTVIDDPLVDELHDAAIQHVAAQSSHAATTTPHLDGSSQVSDSPIEEGADLQLEDAADVSPPTSRSVSAVQPITHEQYTRMRKKASSPIWSIIPVVLGGLASVPIALLILWHLIGRDVAGAGPWVAQYLPAVVPEQFRGNAVEGLSQQQDFDDRSAPDGRNRFRDFDDVMSRSGSPVGQDQEDPGVLGASDSASRGLATMDGMESTSSSGESSTSLTLESTLPSQPNYSSGSEQDMPNIFAMIEESRQDLRDWRTAINGDRSNLRELAQELYKGLADLSSVISTFPEDAQVIRLVRDKMQPLGIEIKRQEDVQQVITQGAAHWLSSFSYESELPIALIVEIESVDELLDLWSVKSVDSQIDAVLVPKNLAPSLTSGQKLLMLGTLLQSPVPGDSSQDTGSVSTGTSTEETESEIAAPTNSLFKARYIYGL